MKKIYILFGLALIVRLVIFIALLIHGGQAEFLLGDSVRYLQIANNVLSNHGYLYKGLIEAYRTPGYPAYFILAGVLHMPLWLLSIVQIIIASLIPVLVYHIARKYLGVSESISFVAALIAAIEPIQVYYSVVLMPDVFFTACFLGTLWAILAWIDTNKISYMILSGALLAVVTYIRPAGIYFVIFLALGLSAYLFIKKLLSLKRIGHIVMLVLTMLVIVLPWYIRNYETFGVWSFTSATSYNFYIYGGVATEAVATNRDYSDVKKDYVKNISQAPDPSNPQSLKNQEFFISTTKSVIKAHPKDYIKTFILGLNTFLFSGNYHYLFYKYGLLKIPTGNTSFSMVLARDGVWKLFLKFFEIFSPYTLIALLGKILWVILVVGSLIGAWMYRKNSVSMLYLISFIYFSVTILSVTIGVEARHRYMLNPLIFLFFTVMIANIYGYLRRRPGL